MKHSRTEIPSKEKKVIRCAIYTRVSFDEKKLDDAGIWRGRKQDTSLKMQEQQCRDYIQLRARQGYEFKELFQDDGFSAKTMRRPALTLII